MMKLVVATLSVIMLAAVPTSAEGQSANCSSSSSHRPMNGATEVVCQDARVAATAGTPKALAPAARTTRIVHPTPDLVRIPAVGSVSPVGICRERTTITIPREQLALPENAQIRIWLTLMGNYPRCPSPLTQPGPDPEDVAIAVLERVPLPSPAPSIAPGLAITGKPGYLEPNLPAPSTAGKPTVVTTRATELGDMAITATAVYLVDWGDEETGPHAGPGGPWPNGNITHTWTTTGTYNVVVRAEWTVEWRMGAATGRLTTTTEGSIPGFRVDQLQAVRNG